MKEISVDFRLTEKLILQRFYISLLESLVSHGPEIKFEPIYPILAFSRVLLQLAKQEGIFRGQELY